MAFDEPVLLAESEASESALVPDDCWLCLESICENQTYEFDPDALRPLILLMEYPLFRILAKRQLPHASNHACL